MRCGALATSRFFNLYVAVHYSRLALAQEYGLRSKSPLRFVGFWPKVSASGNPLMLEPGRREKRVLEPRVPPRRLIDRAGKGNVRGGGANA
jgi:hypothetical protein